MTTLRKVLVVDDDPVVGKSFHRVLSSKGYAVVTAADGAEALAKIAAESYDAVYTDIRMPGMDGVELARNIKAHRPWLPVVIVSGYATPENEARAKEAGVAAVLHKPLSPEMIEASARETVADAMPRFEATVAEAPTPEARAAEAPATLEAVRPTAAPKRVGMLKALGLLLAAPFAGLAYVVVFPVAGLVVALSTAVWAACERFAKRVADFPTFAKNVALFLAAPFIGLAYAIALPFVGLGMIVWMAAKALTKREAH